jgi:hypothetical protein
MTLTKRQVAKLLTKWQEVLRLADWQIVIEIRRAKDMSLANVMGSCTHTLSKKIAFIEIMNPRDYPADWMDVDVERTVVHELLHCHFAPFEAKNRTPEDIAQEQAIHAISTALVELDRKGK